MKTALCPWTLALVVLCQGCGSVFPDPYLGSIEGRLFYDGEQHNQIKNVAVAVVAFGPPVEWNLPSAMAFYPDPDFGEQGLAYELRHLDPYSYTVLATLIDLDHPEAEDRKAVGFYPNLCEAMIFLPYKKVEVGLDGPVQGIDIHLYDNGGMSDPCLGGG